MKMYIFNQDNFNRIFVVKATLVSGLLLLFSCGNAPKTLSSITYNGPFLTVDSMHTIFTDAGKLKFILNAKKQRKFQNDDQEFPEGLHLDFYDTKGETKETSIEANYGYYDNKLGIWKLKGKVFLNNYVAQRTLKSEELFWDPTKHRLWSSKFVRIQTPSQTLTGTGLEAKEDFSEYEILRPGGSFEIQ